HFDLSRRVVVVDDFDRGAPDQRFDPAGASIVFAAIDKGEGSMNFRGADTPNSKRNADRQMQASCITIRVLRINSERLTTLLNGNLIPLWRGWIQMIARR